MQRDEKVYLSQVVIDDKVIREVCPPQLPFFILNQAGAPHYIVTNKADYKSPLNVRRQFAINRFIIKLR